MNFWMALFKLATFQCKYIHSESILAYSQDLGSIFFWLRHDYTLIKSFMAAKDWKAE